MVRTGERLGAHGEGTDRGLDRLVFFADAVAAIAITLLVLPLVDAVPEAAARGLDSADFLRDSAEELLAFVVSFLVVARLWIAHHTVFEHIGSYSRAVRGLSIGWALTVAILPLPTVMWSQLPLDRWSVGLYTGTLLLSSLALTALVWTVHLRPDLEDVDNPMPDSRLWTSLATTGLVALACVVGTPLPAVNFWAMFLLFLAIPAGMVIRRRVDRP